MHSSHQGLLLLLVTLLLLYGNIQGLNCPSGEHIYTCFSCIYIVTDAPLDYAGARETCRSRQADLVTVEDAWQAETIRRYLKSFNESRNVWIGRYYRNSTACYTANSDVGNWRPTPCTLQNPFVCARTYGSVSQLAAGGGGQVFVVNGQMLKLSANVSTVRVIQLEWMHDSKTVGANSVVTTNGTASLTIQSLNISADLGWYRLIVHDPAATYVLATWLVKQARIEAFAAQPRSINISAGDKAVFECYPEPSTTSPPASIIWYKNNVPLSPLTNIYISNFTGTLMIVNVTATDEGVYLCKASNKAGIISSQKATLMVVSQSSSTMQSSFLLQPRNTVVLSGNPFALECVPSPVISGYTFIYTNDNSLVEVLSDRVFPTYLVQSASLANSNNYTCAYLISDSLLKSSRATVQVQTVPQINSIVVKLNETVVLNANTVSVPRGSSMQLVCSYTSIPPPTLVVWLFNGKEVVTGATTSTSQTVLDVAYIDTSGMYQCLVSNVHGHTITGVSICIDDINSLPENVNFIVLPDTQTQLLVQWTPLTATPTTDPLLILYEVVFTSPASLLQTSGLLENHRTDYLIKNLEPGTVYSVTVLAHSVQATSNGVWSTISTFGRVPSEPITGLSIILIDDTSIEVSWNLVETMPSEQPIDSYLLTYSDNRSTNISVTLGHTVSSYILANISTNANFQVCVRYGVQVQRSPAVVEVNPSTSCTNKTDNLVNVGAVGPKSSYTARVNGVLLAVVITVAVVVVIGTLIMVVLVTLYCQKKHGGRYSPARVEKGKEEIFNPDRQRPMGQQVFDLAPTLSMLDEAFNSLSADIVSPKPTDLTITQQLNRIALTPTKDEEML